MADNLRIKDHWQEQRLFLTRVIVTGVVLLLLTGLVIGRLVQLQVAQYETFSAQSQGNRIRVQPVPPIRGLILDRNGEVLAENMPSYQLELVPEQVPDLQDTLARLVDLGLIEAEALEGVRRTIASRRRFDTIAIAERLEEEQVALFAVNRPHFPGVDIRARLARYYRHGPAIAHVLGYMGGIGPEDQARIDRAAYAGTTHIGRSAIERAYEAQLLGTVGREEVLVNAHGRRMQVLGRGPARPGRDLILTIDIETQLAAYEALGGQRGAVVAIDPRNGEVLALVSTPSFDPTALSTGISRRDFLALQENEDRPLFNRALRGQYPPGSTIKPIMGLAGLHYNVVTPGHRMMCRGFYQLPGSRHRFRDWRPQGHGMVDLHESIVQSCDVYFYDLAREMGIERMAAFLQTFGLGGTSGLDIPGEQPGLVPTPAWKRTAFRNPQDQAWFPGETVIAGIGQGYMLTTPLQLAWSTATVAARGVRYRPQLLLGQRDPLSGQVWLSEPELQEPVPVDDAQQWAVVIDAMRDVLHGPRGTARAVGQGALIEIAGKSGTAQVFTVAQDQRYEDLDVPERLRDHALFVAFAPIEAPSIAVAVIVENGESGSRVAAPVARQVIETHLRLGS